MFLTKNIKFKKKSCKVFYKKEEELKKREKNKQVSKQV